MVDILIIFFTVQVQANPASISKAPSSQQHDLEQSWFSRVHFMVASENNLNPMLQC